MNIAAIRQFRTKIYGCLLFFCLALFVPITTAQGIELTPFVDGHIHMNNRQALLQLMDQEKIAKAVIFWGRDSDNEELLAATKAHPDRFIPFASISPERRSYRQFWNSNDSALLTKLELLLETGVFKGIGEISVVHFPSRGFPEADYDPDGILMNGIMTLAKKYQIPVNIHCEITRLREFTRLLETYPTVQVIWAHGGYTPYFLARRLLKRHSNLIYELSARIYLRHPRSPDYTIFRNETEVWPRWLELIESNPERFIIGTDNSQRRQTTDKQNVDRVRLLLSQLTPSTRELVAAGNILRLTTN